MIEIGEDGAITVFADDLIADRMGRYASGSANEMLIRRKRCSSFLDRWIGDYMDCRIPEGLAQDYAFKTLKTKRKAVSLAALGKEIAARRVVVGEVSLPRNAGTRRTASKAALLKQIVKAGGNW